MKNQKIKIDKFKNIKKIKCIEKETKYKNKIKSIKSIK